MPLPRRSSSTAARRSCPSAVAPSPPSVEHREGVGEAIRVVALLPQEGEASALQGLTEVSEHTRQLVDAEVKRIVGEAHDVAIRLMTEHRERLDSLAEALAWAETLDQPEAYAAAGLAAPAAETATAEPALTGAA